MDFSETANVLEEYHKRQSEKYKHNKHEVIVETVWYQLAMENFLKKNSKMDILGKKPSGSKRERLILTTDLIRTGRIKFPKTEAWVMLVEQLVWFGKERHDDLVDAFTMMVGEMFNREDHIFCIWTF